LGLFSNLDILAHISCMLHHSTSNTTKHDLNSTTRQRTSVVATTTPHVIPLVTPIQKTGMREECIIQSQLVKDESFATPSTCSAPSSPTDITNAQRNLFSESNSDCHDDCFDTVLPPISTLLGGIKYYFPQHPSTTSQAIVTHAPTIQFLSS
jgi:hypothetical protein